MQVCMVCVCVWLLGDGGRGAVDGAEGAAASLLSRQQGSRVRPLVEIVQLFRPKDSTWKHHLQRITDIYLPNGRQGINKKFKYALNYQPRWDMYGRMLNKLAATIPVMTTPGGCTTTPGGFERWMDGRVGGLAGLCTLVGTPPQGEHVAMMSAAPFAWEGGRLSSGRCPDLPQPTSQTRSSQTRLAPSKYTRKQHTLAFKPRQSRDGISAGWHRVCCLYKQVRLTEACRLTEV